MCFYLCCWGLSVAGPVSINHSKVTQRNNIGSSRKKQGNYKALIMEAPITAAAPDGEVNGFYNLQGSIWGKFDKIYLCYENLSDIYLFFSYIL